MKTLPRLLVSICIVMNLTNTVNIYGSIHQQQFIPLAIGLSIAVGCGLHSLLFANKKYKETNNEWLDRHTDTFDNVH